MPAEDHADILADYYDQAAVVLKDLMTHPNGKTDRAREFNQSRYAQLLGQVEQIRGRLKRKAAAVTGAAMTEAAKAGTENAIQQAEQSGIRKEGSAMEGSFNLVNYRAVELVARDTALHLNKAADSMADRTKGILRQMLQQHLSNDQVNKILVRGIIEGDPDGAIRRLAAEFEKVVGKGQMVQAGKMSYPPKYYAQMVVITRTRQAVVLAEIAQLQAINIFLVKIHGRQSKNFCTAFLDKVFFIGEGTHPKYPRLDSLPSHGPPFHPFCSKGIAAYVEALASDQAKQRAEGVTDADKLLGVDPTEAQRRFKDLQIEKQIEALQKKTQDTKVKTGSAAAIESVVEQAKDLGVKKIDISPAPDVGRKVVNALETAKRNRLPIPKKLTLDGEDRAVKATRDTLVINPEAEIWTKGDRERELYRELAKLEFEGFVDGPLSADDRAIARKLNAAASGSKLDFLVESRAAIAAGKRLPDDVEALYRKISREVA